MLEVTIPVLNEEATLEQNVLKACAYLSAEITNSFMLILADNGSTDRTAAIGLELQKTHKNIKYLRVAKRGVGLALRTSWQQSTSDIVGYMDLDLATDLIHLKKAYHLLAENQCDIVNGSRLMHGAVVKKRSPLREVTSRAFNQLVRALLGVNLSDGMCGFKFFRRETAIKLLDTGITTDNWFFSTEMLVKALWLDERLTEIPVSWTDDGLSKVNIPTLSWQYFREILRLRKEKAHFMKNTTPKSLKFGA
ncbi:MAG: glycosyltransferase [Saprospiraceae bacterium]|nr:glycosyltransferase [Saprospiraceae bacterium]